jgi:fructokinase
VSKPVALWVLGESLMDCVAQPDGSLMPLLGGSPYNLACAAALQGVEVGWLTPFSSDTFGQALRMRLAQVNAQALLPASPKPTALAVVHLEQGTPSYGFYREGVADRDYAVQDILRLIDAHAPGVLHTGSLMAVPPDHLKTLDVVRYAKARGWTISVDLNLRPRLAAHLDHYLQTVQELSHYADWLKASDEDLVLLGEENVIPTQASQLAQRWMKQGCQRLALTFGAWGAYLQVGADSAIAQAPKVEVVDTVGAGDTFWGSCLADWIEHQTLHQPEVALQRLEQTLQRAITAAAMNCTRKGCQPPSRQELTQFASFNKSS